MARAKPPTRLGGRSSFQLRASVRCSNLPCLCWHSTILSSAATRCSVLPRLCPNHVRVQPKPRGQSPSLPLLPLPLPPLLLQPMPQQCCHCCHCPTHCRFCLNHFRLPFDCCVLGDEGKAPNQARRVQLLSAGCCCMLQQSASALPMQHHSAKCSRALQHSALALPQSCKGAAQATRAKPKP